MKENTSKVVYNSGNLKEIGLTVKFSKELFIKETNCKKWEGHNFHRKNSIWEKKTCAVSSCFFSNSLAMGGGVAFVPNQLDVREQNSLLNWSVQSFPRSSNAMNPKRHTATQSATNFTLWFCITLSCGPGNRCIAFQIPRQSHNMSVQTRKYLRQISKKD